jgi:hypothetical protein
MEIAKAGLLEIGKCQSTNGAGRVSDRVCANIPVFGGVGSFAHAAGVHHDDYGPSHASSIAGHQGV